MSRYPESKRAPLPDDVLKAVPELIKYLESESYVIRTTTSSRRLSEHFMTSVVVLERWVLGKGPLSNDETVENGVRQDVGSQ